MKSDSTLSAARKHTKYQALNRIGFSKQWESLYAFILVERHLMQELGIYKLIRRARKKVLAWVLPYLPQPFWKYLVISLPTELHILTFQTLWNIISERLLLNWWCLRVMEMEHLSSKSLPNIHIILSRWHYSKFLCNHFAYFPHPSHSSNPLILKYLFHRAFIFQPQFVIYVNVEMKE